MSEIGDKAQEAVERANEGSGGFTNIIAVLVAIGVSVGESVLDAVGVRLTVVVMAALPTS